MIAVVETWYSPELKITLFPVNSDPRTGTRTTEVTEIDRTEPDPAVFQVPDGYTVKDATMPVANSSLSRGYRLHGVKHFGCPCNAISPPTYALGNMATGYRLGLVRDRRSDSHAA
jgi:hypothetical protein